MRVLGNGSSRWVRQAGADIDAAWSGPLTVDFLASRLLTHFSPQAAQQRGGSHHTVLSTLQQHAKATVYRRYDDDRGSRHLRQEYDAHPSRLRKHIWAYRPERRFDSIDVAPQALPRRRVTYMPILPK